MITPMEELRRKDDAFIIDMLDNQSGHSKEHLQAASIIFEERNLADPTKQQLVKKYPEIKEDVSRRIIAGEDSNMLRQDLRAQGMSDADAKQMIERAAQKHNAEVINKRKALSTKRAMIISFIIGAVVAYFTVRYFVK